MNESHKKIGLGVIFILLFVVSHKIIMEDKFKHFPEDRKISYAQFIEEVKRGNIRDVTFRDGSIIKGSFKKKDKKNRNIYFTTKGNTGDVSLKILMKNGVMPHYEEEEEFSFYGILIMNLGAFYRNYFCYLSTSKRDTSKCRKEHELQ